MIMKRRELIRSLGLLAATTAAVGVSSVALARVGRPASPTSVAGVRRRTTRRRVRRSRRIHRHMTLYALPYGCSVTRYRGSVRYYYCSGIWYRPAYQGTTVIYIVEDIEAGASTDVIFME
jgi:hypothetical protein